MIKKGANQMTITTIYTFAEKIEHALKHQNYPDADRFRLRAFAFLNEVHTFWNRLRIKHMYIFKAPYDQSVDLNKIAKDVAILKNKYDWDSEKRKSEYPSLNGAPYSNYSHSTFNKDNDVTTYDISPYV